MSTQPIWSTKPRPTVHPRKVVCGLCGSSFTRRDTIRRTHFAVCSRKNGNPRKVVWDHDQTCWTKLPNGQLGPSGLEPYGMLEQEETEQDETEQEGTEQDETDQDETEQEETENQVVIDQQYPSATLAGPSNHQASHLLPPWVPSAAAVAAFAKLTTFSADEDPIYQEMLATLPENQWYFSGNDTGPVRAEEYDRPPLSHEVMNALASTAIHATEKKIMLNEDAALSAWDHWCDLYPEGVDENGLIRFSLIGASASQKARIIMAMAADQCKKGIGNAHDFVAQMHVAGGFKHIHYVCDPKGGKEEDTMYEILGEAIGTIGPHLPLR